MVLLSLRSGKTFAIGGLIELGHFRLVCLGVIVLHLSGCGPAFISFEKFDPGLKWEVLESSHFEVYFQPEEKEIALKASEISEEVHQALSRQFQWTPQSKTGLIISDHLDSAFGEALSFPSNIIEISLTQPVSGLGIQPIRYEDWLRLVITHEYTHILHLDSVGGFPSFMRHLFGRNPIPLFSLPNLWQPLWMIEGLAVYMETTHGTSDRMDNVFTEMILRTSILDHRIDSIDQAGGALTRWPDGLVPYLYGARFYEFLADKYGAEKLTEISRRYSQNAIPFRVESTALEVLGTDFPDLWAEWLSRLYAHYSLEEKKIKERGLTPVRSLTERGNLILGGRYSPDGKKILYTESTPDQYPEFHLMDRNGKNDTVLSIRNSGFDAGWSPDSGKIVYSQLEIYKTFYLVSDLYMYDLSTRETRRLSFGLRAKEVDYSPEGRFLVFVQEKMGKNRMALWDFEQSRVTGLTPFSDTFLISNPRWFNNENEIIFSGWKNGTLNIYLLKRETHQIVQLTDDSFQNFTPVPGFDGHHIIFRSDRTGIYNMFSLDLKTREISQLTNVSGGVFFPSVSPDRKQILFSNYTVRGFDLSEMDSGFIFQRKEEKESITNQIKRRVENRIRTDLSKTPESRVLRQYSPWNTLFPAFWVPWGGIDEEGLQLGAWTTGGDVLRKHRYLAMGLYGLESHRFSYLLDYLNDQYYPTLNVGYSDMPKYYANLLSNPVSERVSYWERQQVLKASALFPLLKLHSRHYLRIGFEKRDFSALSSVPDGFSAPQTGSLKTVKGGWIYDTSEEFPLSISKEEGTTIQLTFEQADRVWGSDYNLKKYIANLRLYHPLLVPHGVIAGQITGGGAQGDRLIQRAFQLGGPLTIDQPFLDQDEFFLRGYPSHQWIGQNMVVANLEYRFPLRFVEKGNGNFPLFIKKLHAGVFVDYGDAWDQTPSLGDFKTGTGAELKLDFNLFYHIPVRARLGTAFGLNSSGEKEIYLSMENAF